MRKIFIRGTDEAVRRHLVEAGGDLVNDALLADTVVIALGADLRREAEALPAVLFALRGRRIVFFDAAPTPLRQAMVTAILRRVPANAIAASCPEAVPAALDVVLAAASGLLDAVRGQLLVVDPPREAPSRRPSLAA